jgi:hypothetical protein
MFSKKIYILQTKDLIDLKYSRMVYNYKINFWYFIKFSVQLFLAQLLFKIMAF